MTAQKSPDSLQLRKKPNIGPRLGGRAAAIGGGVVVLLLAVIVFNTESRKHQNEAKPQAASSEADMKLAPAASGATAVTRGVTDELKVATAPTLPTPPPAFDINAAMAQQAPQPAPGAYVVPDLSGSTAGQGVPPLGMSDADRRLLEERQRLEGEARKGETKVRGWQVANESAPASAAIGSAASQVAPGMADLAAMSKQLQDMQSGGMQMPGMPGQQQEPNDQAKKQEFIAAAQQIEAPILGATRQAPRSAYELKTGHVIPGILLRGINSDLPGEVTAMVTENVYDTATGRYLLIPAWTKIFGKYDSEVAYGQQRGLVVWTRLIYPDGSTLELGGMQGADMAGYSGFKDKVNNHYGKLIGFSVLSSLMSAGLQLSQPQENSQTGQLSNRQIVAGEAGRELSQLGGELARRNLNVQPTIIIRNGYKFTITVNRDVAFAAPYVAN